MVGSLENKVRGTFVADRKGFSAFTGMYVSKGDVTPPYVNGDVQLT